MKLTVLLFVLVAPCAAQEHWVSTWAAAQQAPRAAADAVSNQTVRMILRATAGGRRERVEFSNIYGTTPLAIGAAHLALRAKDSAIVPSSDRELTVNGKRSFSIPPGALIWTDAVDLEVPSLAELAVSVFIPDKAAPLTQHSLGLHTTYISAEGNATSQQMITAARSVETWFWLSGLEVMAPATTSAIVAFGDSITEGYKSTSDTDSMWPAELARRIFAKSAGPQMAIVNEAISGNQILKDRMGVNALARFDRDVLAINGVKWLVILEGINDIGMSGAGGDEVIAGQRQMIERAHAHGISVIGATLLPYEGAAYATDKGEMARTTVNEWIRTSGVYDAVIDFEAVTRDPQHPSRMRAEFDSGDHLHPNDAGYKAMGDAVDISLFKKH